MTAIMLCYANETHVIGIRIRYSVQVQACIPVYLLLMDVQARPKHESNESTNRCSTRTVLVQHSNYSQLP